MAKGERERFRGLSIGGDGLLNNKERTVMRSIKLAGFRLLVVIVLCVVAAGCGGGAAGGTAGGGNVGGSEPGRKVTLSGLEITVGSKEFTEQKILGQITIQPLEATGATVEDRTGLAGTAATRRALTSGRVWLENTTPIVPSPSTNPSTP